MRICLLSNSKAVHTQRWAQSLSERGHEVHVVNVRAIPIGGVEVHRVGIGWSKNPRGKLVLFFSYLKLLFCIKRIIAQIKPDILHAHYVAHNGIIGAFSGFHPYVVSTWGADVLDPPATNPIFKQIIKFSLRKADAVIALSRFLLGKMKPLLSSQRNVHIIPFGVDSSQFNPQPRSFKGWVTIGIIKSLEKKYGVEYLIRAFSAVHKRYPNTKLLIVGEGSLREHLERLSASIGFSDENIKFIGRIPHKEVPKYLSEIDIFCMPSIYQSETFGVAAIEASAMQIPVVASKIGGISEAIKDGVTGFLVPPKNPEAIAEAIINLIENPELRIRMGKAGRKYVMENYDWHKNVWEIEKLYQSILKGRK